MTVATRGMDARALPAARRAATAARRGRHADRRRWVLAQLCGVRRWRPADWSIDTRAAVATWCEAGAFADATWLVETLWRHADDPRERLTVAACAAEVALGAGRLAPAIRWAEHAASLAACLDVADPSRECAAVARRWRDGAGDAPRDLRAWIGADRWCGDTPDDGGTAGVWARAVRAQRALDAGDDDGARAWAAAPLRRRRCRGLADVALAAVRQSLGLATRDERQWLAAWLCDEAPAGWGRWGRRERSMTESRSFAALLVDLRTVPTDGDALTLVAAWAARELRGRVMVCDRDGRPVAGPAWAPADFAPAAIVRAMTTAGAPPGGGSGAVLGPSADPARTRVWAPLREGDAMLGAVVGETPAWRAAVATDVLTVAAALVHPHVARLRGAAAVAPALERGIVGVSPAMQAVRAAAARAATVPFAAVIEGESGTGKELVARAVHQLGPRARQPFVAINCAALPEELAEAELFGHAKGAFTHAVTARAGLFEEAHRGTLFLDEVGELTPRAQAKLLRALQEGEVRRVGETVARPVDVRVVVATNRPLDALVAAGRFREDLFFRLGVIRLRLPPLRDRAEDIAPLAEAFWRVSARTAGTRATLGADAIAVLAAQPWPGNVRQLQNTMAALAVAAPAAGRVTAALVTTVIGDADAPPGAVPLLPLEQARRDVERRMVSAALSRHAARADAARALGLSRQGLDKAMRRLGLAAVRPRAGVA